MHPAKVALFAHSLGLEGPHGLLAPWPCRDGHQPLGIDPARSLTGPLARRAIATMGLARGMGTV